MDIEIRFGFGTGWIAERFNLYKSRIGNENAEEFYNDAVNKLKILQSELAGIYKIDNIANRQLALKELEVKYGTSDFSTLVKQLTEQKNYTFNILSSRYAENNGWTPIRFHNDGSIPLDDTPAARSGMITGNVLNPYYNEFYDFDSESRILERETAGISKEEQINQFVTEFGFPDDALSFINPKDESSYVDPADGTDQWGRLPSDPNFGINPALIPETTEVNPEGFKLPGEFPGSIAEFDETYGLNNTNTGDGNEEIVDEKPFKLPGEYPGTVEEFNAEYGLNDTNTGDGNEEVVETPNRLQLMTTAIEENPSRIQEHLIESGFTAERLAKLQIKDEAFQEAKGNKELMIKFQQDKAAGVYN